MNGQVWLDLGAQPHVPTPTPRTRSIARRFDCKQDFWFSAEITWRNFHHFPLGASQTSIDCPRYERRSRTTNPRLFDPVDNLDTSNPRQNGASRFRFRLKNLSARKAGVTVLSVFWSASKKVHAHTTSPSRTTPLAPPSANRCICDPSTTNDSKEAITADNIAVYQQDQGRQLVVEEQG